MKQRVNQDSADVERRKQRRGENQARAAPSRVRTRFSIRNCPVRVRDEAPKALRTPISDARSRMRREIDVDQVQSRHQHEEEHERKQRRDRRSGCASRTVFTEEDPGVTASNCVSAPAIEPLVDAWDPGVGTRRMRDWNSALMQESRRAPGQQEGHEVTGDPACKVASRDV